MDQEFVLTMTGIIISAVALVASRYVIPFIKLSVNQDKLNTITLWIKEAVHAADQIMQSSKGSEKKAYVLKFMEKIIASIGIQITEEELDVLIESAVKQLKIDSNSQ